MTTLLWGFSPKSFEINTNNLFHAQLNKEQQTLAKTSQRCHIKQNLREHSALVQKNIIPRIEQELKQLLSLQQTKDGKIFYVAESIDYGDLFHAHVRDPLYNIPYSEELGLNHQFKDSREYHIQYHSFEYRDFTHLKWINELKLIHNSDLNVWLNELETYIREANSQTSGEYSNSNNAAQSRLKALSPEQKILYSLLWHQKLGSQSPGQNRLSQRLSSLDPLNNKTQLDMFSYRSVVSTDDEFMIIKPLNLPDFEQNATIYFEERIDSPEVDQIIKKAQKNGLDHLINVSSRYYSDLSFGPIKNKALHQKFSQEIFLASQKTTEKNKLYMFGHAFKDDSDQNQHLLITWSDKYLFSVRYFIPCEDTDLEVWKKITSPGF